MFSKCCSEKGREIEAILSSTQLPQDFYTRYQKCKRDYRELIEQAIEVNGHEDFPEFFIQGERIIERYMILKQEIEIILALRLK